MTRSRLLWACLLVSFAVALHARGADAPKAATQYDIVYAKPGGTELKLDLVQPGEGEGPFPAVLVIHGGGWRGGSKDGMRPALAELARRGYVAVAPQYRFCPKERFPAQVYDVKAAVRWVKSHAGEHKIDPDRIGALGFSAGGHLALMLGLTGPSDGLEGDVAAGAPDSKIRAVVNYFGPTDLAADDIPAISRSVVSDFLGGSPSQKPKEAAQASPLTFVSKDDAPVLTIQGTKDPLVPVTQATKLGKALTAAGVANRVDLVEGAGHGWTGKELERTLKDTFSFLDQYLKPTGR
jgi:acetyl esterase/lipase